MHRRLFPTATIGMLALCACDPGVLDGGTLTIGRADGGGRDADGDGGDDAGPPPDTGLAEDAGWSLDAGEAESLDAGAPWDAGGQGALEDAGAPPPDGADAGVDDPALVEKIDHAFLIEHFGGTVVDAMAYSDDLAGFQQYLDDVGVQYFSANEITTPNNPTAAQMCGYDILLPDPSWWEKIGALALLADELRALVGEPVFMRNWWRPPCYNELVGGAAGGDHPDADAVDLDFLSAGSRALAQGYLCEQYWAQDIVPPEAIAPGSDLDPRLNLSVGMGGATLHVGLLSVNGRRFWFYGSYTDEPGSGDCW
jgi:hypothetical protein